MLSACGVECDCRLHHNFSDYVSFINNISGSAAPSRRPSLSAIVPFLLLAVGAVVVVFQPWNGDGDDDSNPKNSAEIRDQLEPETGAIVESVALGAGWTTPDLSTVAHGQATTGADDSSDQGASGSAPDSSVEISNGSAIDPLDHEHELELLAPGTQTVGAQLELVTGSPKSVIIDGLGNAQLGFRSFSLGAWTQWQLMASSPFEGPDGGEGSEGSGGEQQAEGTTAVGSVGPIWLGEDVKALEIVVVGGQAPANLKAIILPGGGNGDDPAPAGPSTGDGEPTIIPRAQWATSSWNYGNDDCDNGPTVADTVSAVVVHHTVTDNTYRREDVPDLLRAIYHHHVRVNGWCDIGYNFVVDRFGRIWEARTGSAQSLVVGGHAKGFNTGTIGIAMLGQFQSGITPTAANPGNPMIPAVTDLAEARLTEHGIDPNGKTWLRNRSSSGAQKLAGESWHYVPTILAHRDLGITSCPGDQTLPWLRALPDYLNGRRNQQPPYQTSDWAPKGNGPGFVVVDQRGGLRAAGSTNGIPEVIDKSGENAASDITVVAVAGVAQSGYALTSQWKLVPYGGAPAIVVPRNGNAAPVDLVLRADGRSGWVLSQAGNLTGFGGAADIGAPRKTSNAVAADLLDTGHGYVLDADGTISAVGGAPPVKTIVAGRPVDLAIRETQNPAAASGWAVAEDGTVTSFNASSSARSQTSKLRSENGASPQAVRAIAAARGAEGGGWALDATGQLWPFGGARHISPFYGDSTTQDVVDLAEVGTTITPAFLESDDAVYVAALYELFRGRAATEQEIDLGVSTLEEGSDRSDLAETLARSDYWAGREIEHMYLDVLGRSPDAPGREYWVDQVRRGLRYQDLGLYFYGADEYVRSSGSNENFVRRLYRDLLNREPEAEGFGYWTGLLNSKSTEPPVVTQSFYASIESRTARARRLYQTILGTDIAGKDRQEWANKLLEIDDLALAAEIAGSGDYYDLIVLGETP